MKYAIAAVLIPFIIWNLTVDFFVGLVMLAILVVYWNKVSTGIAIGIAAYILMLPILFDSITHMSKDYTSKIKRGEELNIIETWNIYGLHLAMIGTAYPFYPEVAKEAFYMHIPNKSDTIIFNSDFFLKSDKFQDAIKRSNKGIVRWRYADYRIGGKETRYALALAPTKYEKTSKGYETSILIGYNPNCHAKFIDTKYVKLEVSESMFYYLEKRGLLHKYTAVWRNYE